MLQIGYKKKEGDMSVVKLITLLLDQSVFKEEWLGEPLTTLEAESSFILENKEDFKSFQYIQDNFYNLVDEGKKVYLKNDGKKYYIEQGKDEDKTGQKFTLVNELDMDLMCSMLENYFEEIEDGFILTLIYDEEERTVKPYFTMYEGPDNEDEEAEGSVCIPFRNVDAIVKYIRENEEDEEGEDDNE